MAEDAARKDICPKHGDPKVRLTVRVFGRAATRFACEKCDAETQARLNTRGR